MDLLKLFPLASVLLFLRNTKVTSPSIDYAVSHVVMITGNVMFATPLKDPRSMHYFHKTIIWFGREEEGEGGRGREGEGGERKGRV